jgi:hypothetical protein
MDNLAGALRDSLATIGGSAYDRFGSRDQAAFYSLNLAAESLKTLLPLHYLVPFSRGVGNLPAGLWLAVLDPEVTTSPTRGVYIVYLFDSTQSTVTLSLNQGVTNARVQARKEGLGTRDLLRREASGIRQLLSPAVIDGLAINIQLGQTSLMREYEAGNVVGRTYDLAALPDVQILKDDLRRFLDLYSSAVNLVESALQIKSDLVSVPPRGVAALQPTVDIRFEPKDASDYRARIAVQEQVRTRSHEDLVRRLGEWSRARGFEPNTHVHPRDLVLHGDEHGNLLVEVKVFTAGRPRESIRSAIGQLFEYELFFPSPNTRLVAALSESPGDAYCDLLTKLGIATVWPNRSGWVGTVLAKEFGLVPW